MQFTSRILDHNFSHNMIRIKVSFNTVRFYEPVKVWSFRLSVDTGEKLKRYTRIDRKILVRVLLRIVIQKRQNASEYSTFFLQFSRFSL